MRKNYQAIFQIKINDEWLDYVRKQVDQPADAEPMMFGYQSGEGKPFRVSVEHWNEREPREPTVRYGEW